MKYSIKLHFAAVYIALMAMCMTCCFLVNRFFLEKYYMNQKENSLQAVYDFLNTRYNWEEIRLLESLSPRNYEYNYGDDWDTFSEEDMVLDDTDRELQQLCSKFNVQLLVLDSRGDVLKSNVFNVNALRRQLLEMVLLPATWNGANQDNGSEDRPARTVIPKILDVTDNYVRMLTKDNFLNIEFIEMWGFLESGDVFILRTPFENMRENVKISNVFLFRVSIVFIIIGAILTYAISSKVTVPIIKLTKISEKMAKLDFETRYTGSVNNEIGQLGKNMNILSTTLESTISELKTLNLELQKDVEQKEKTDAMRREFLSNVSHELKTPIALIQGYAEGLTESVNDDDSRDFYCEVIIDEARRMNNLVQSLLTLDNIESGTDTLFMEKIDISEMFGNIIASMDLIIKQKNVSVWNDLDSHLMVWGDAGRCENIIRNYIGNALNHVNENGVIRVYSTRTDSSLIFSIFNSGSAIPEENLPHIWEKFYKVDKARTREYGGSGVGLSIVKAACESMDMKYGVRNCVDGVEFYFEAPADRGIDLVSHRIASED